MKKIIILLMITIFVPCVVVSYTQVNTMNWKNPLLQENMSISYSSSPYTNDRYYKSHKNSTISFDNGLFTSKSRHFNTPKSCGGFGGSSISFSGGSFNNVGETYTNPSTSIPFQTYSPSELMLNNKKNDGVFVYTGDKPGIISVEENKLLDNPIIGASTYAEESLPPIICPRCSTNLGTIIIYDRGSWYGRNRYSLKGSGNFWSWLGSLFGNGEGYATLEEAKTAAATKSKEILDEHLKTCKDHPGAPIGDISFGIILMFILIYCVALKFNKPIH